MARRREHCLTCGRHITDCGDLSRRGYCDRCGTEAAVEAARQMAAKRGPYYERWLQSKGNRGRPETPYGPVSPGD